MWHHHIPALKEISKLNLIENQDTLPKNVQFNITRSSRSLIGLEVFSNQFAKELYRKSSNDPTWGGGDLVDGGGPLALKVKTIKSFALKLLTRLLHNNMSTVKVLWVSESI